MRKTAMCLRAAHAQRKALLSYRYVLSTEYFASLKHDSKNICMPTQRILLEPTNIEFLRLTFEKQNELESLNQLSKIIKPSHLTRGAVSSAVKDEYPDDLEQKSFDRRVGRHIEGWLNYDLLKENVIRSNLKKLELTHKFEHLLQEYYTTFAQTFSEDFDVSGPEIRNLIVAFAKAQRIAMQVYRLHLREFVFPKKFMSKNPECRTTRKALENPMGIELLSMVYEHEKTNSPENLASAGLRKATGDTSVILSRTSIAETYKQQYSDPSDLGSIRRKISRYVDGWVKCKLVLEENAATKPIKLITTPLFTNLVETYYDTLTRELANSQFLPIIRELRN